MIPSAADLAAIIREQLHHLGPERGATGEAALDALVAERDAFKRARLDDVRLIEQRTEALKRAESAEAERDEALLAVRALERNRDLRCEELEAELDEWKAKADSWRANELDTLDRLGAAEAERDRIADNNKHTHANLDFCIEQRMAAEAEVKRLESYSRVPITPERLRGLQQAEAERDGLREALAQYRMSSHVDVQTCPKCGGQGFVSVPPYVPGDVHSWPGTTTCSYSCPVCHGAKTIARAALADKEGT